MSDDTGAFYQGLKKCVSEVFEEHPELPDHREEFPWLIGSLGDPFSPVWFVAENPSITQVMKAVGASPELQWSVSDGDRLLRRALSENGFKDGELLEHGGWRCYITDVLKSAVKVKDWQGTTRDEKSLVAEAWAPVVKYELEHGRPEYIVFLGKNAMKIMNYQSKKGLIPPIPRHEWIYHYTYLTTKPHGKVGPRNPGRIATWIEHFADVAERFPRKS